MAYQKKEGNEIDEIMETTHKKPNFKRKLEYDDDHDKDN